MDISGQVVLITGASTGIGANTAVYLAQFKVKLALVARSKVKLSEVKDKCVNKGLQEDEVLIIEADVGKAENIPRIVQSTIDAFGRIDHLVNNAAVLAFEDVQHSTLDTFEHVTNVNLRAPLFLSKEAMPHLKKTKGSIVNISSLNGQQAEHACVMYSLTKAALEHLTRITAHEVAKDGVRVNAIVPGFVLTDTMLHGHPDDKKTEIEEHIRRESMSRMPLGGALSMDQVSSAILFLLTPGASGITGECIRVDNGGHLALPENEGGVKVDELLNSGIYNSDPVQERQARQTQEEKSLV